ncbi:MAG: hypothetical protein AABO58_17545 [Acidobacteriota bacterium]
MTLGVLLILIAIIALAQSWRRWLDPIIDTGRDLYIPEQLLGGAKLYRDIRYQYPPLAPYLLAAITAVIGHSLAAYIAIGIAQSAVVAAALWIALRRAAGEVAAFAATLMFVALSFCGASTWGANFIFPYAYASTIGMALVVVALAAFVHARNGLALGCLVAASFCKVEYAVAAIVIVAVLAIARRITLCQLAVFAIAATATGIYFFTIRENIFPASLVHGRIAERFYGFVSGRADWKSSVAQALIGVAIIAAIALLLRLPQRWWTITLVLVLCVAGASHSFIRAWGFLQWVALVYAFVRDRNGALLLFAAFSAATTLRIPLAVSPVWYGFVLVVPAYALIAYVCRSVWWMPLIALLCGRDLVEQHQRYAVKQFPIVSARGTFYDWNPDRARILSELVARVRGGTLAVMPEGVTLNYLTRTRTTLSYHTFTPVETAYPDVERDILHELSAHPPDRVAVVQRDVREFGYQGFGVDYDQEIVAWLRANYALEAQWREPRFSTLLLRR